MNSQDEIKIEALAEQWVNLIFAHIESNKQIEEKKLVSRSQKVMKILNNKKDDR